ncbi:unnamed protein product [Ambrosiozyma monospora]|uniref:Unnamed protein product n=1 Tax=Ambrosiozyma monospora TaxID=43982 RepID=A0A9W7DJ79_AMBMO|nr:unnamed protein product [Ambrosiozyma monospora]
MYNNYNNDNMNTANYNSKNNNNNINMNMNTATANNNNNTNSNRNSFTPFQNQRKQPPGDLDTSTTHPDDIVTPLRSRKRMSVATPVSTTTNSSNENWHDAKENHDDTTFNENADDLFGYNSQMQNQSHNPTMSLSVPQFTKGHQSNASVDSFDAKFNSVDKFDNLFQEDLNAEFDNTMDMDMDMDNNNNTNGDTTIDRVSFGLGDKEKEVEDELQQLLSMKKELSPPTSSEPSFPPLDSFSSGPGVGSLSDGIPPRSELRIDSPLNETFGSSISSKRVSSGIEISKSGAGAGAGLYGAANGNNRLSTNGILPIDTGKRLSSSGPLYSSANGAHRLSTMQTDDLKIYNLNESEHGHDDHDGDDYDGLQKSKEQPIQDMSIIHEDNEFDEEDAKLIEGLSRMKVTALDTPRIKTSPNPNPNSNSNGSASPNESNNNNNNQSLDPSIDEDNDNILKHSLSATNTSQIMQKSSSAASRSRGTTPNLPSLPSFPGMVPQIQLTTAEEPVIPKPPPEPKFAPGTGPCRRCKKEIKPDEKSIWSKDNQLSGQWHRRCFSCYTCKSKFSRGSSCYVYQDQPYCQIHFHELNGSLCRICHKGVEGECLENEIEEVFHPDCLKCDYCGIQIRNDYFLYRRMVLCEEDAEKQRQVLLEDGKTVDGVTKRRTRVMYI